MKTKKCAGVPEVKLRLDPTRCMKRSELTVIRTPDQVLELFRELAGEDAQESFIAVYLASDNAVLAVQRVSIGGFGTAPVDPKALFASALVAGASAFIIGHNHPSGSVQPSAADEDLTRSIVEAAKLLTLRCLDHIIFSPTDSYSFVQHGRLKFS